MITLNSCAGVPQFQPHHALRGSESANTMITIVPPADATDDEVAAALAAIQFLLANEAVAGDPPAQRAFTRSVISVAVGSKFAVGELDA